MIDDFIAWFVRGCGNDERVDWRICVLARVSLAFTAVVGLASLVEWMM